MEREDIKLSIVMPVRNEGVNIKIMLKILKATVEVPHEAIVVYDEEGDDSVPPAREMQSCYPGLKLVHNEAGRGVVNAIRAGVKNASGKYVLLFAVDEVGPVLAIDDMVTLMNEGCDLVSCTRYAYGGRRLGGSLIGGILSRAGNKLFNIMAGAVFTDGTTGIKMFRKDLFAKMPIESKPVGWAVVFEIAIKAQMAGMKIGEVPITSVDRLYGGESTFSPGPWIREYMRWFIWGIFKLRGAKNAQKAAVRIPSNLMKGNKLK